MLAPSQTVQDLQRARNLIADRAKWHNCASDDPGRYCAIQADLHVRGIPDIPLGGNWHKVSPLLIAAAWELFREKGLRAPELSRASLVWRVNDDLGHQAVMRMYDRAIELATAGGAS